MINVAKLGSSCFGYCKIHKKFFTGTVITGSPTEFVEGLPIARWGDVVYSPCGHTGSIITASTTRFANGIGVARLGDQTEGVFVGTIITGCTTVFTL